MLVHRALLRTSDSVKVGERDAIRLPPFDRLLSARVAMGSSSMRVTVARETYSMSKVLREQSSINSVSYSNKSETRWS